MAKSAQEARQLLGISRGEQERRMLAAVIHMEVRRDLCPKCGGSLDTGWECNNCGADWFDVAQVAVFKKPVH